MEVLLDSTLITILIILLVATIAALIKARHRDRCLKTLDGYRVTLAEKGGNLTWGEVLVLTTGMEVEYVAPVVSEQGFVERSYLFYKDQYAGMDGVYLCPEGLPEEQREKRLKYLHRVSNPGPFRRLRRRIRNWVGMIRDAVIQSMGLIMGVVSKGRAQAGAVLSRDEQGFKKLSADIVGQTGNAYDPLLERHLFRRVVVDVTREGTTHSYCGRLADYTADFVQVVDATAHAEPRPEGLVLARHSIGSEPIAGLTIELVDEALVITNHSGEAFYLHALHPPEGGAPREMNVVLPRGFRADMRLNGLAPVAAGLTVELGAAPRIDMVVPRAHALVRHGVARQDATS